MKTIHLSTAVLAGFLLFSCGRDKRSGAESGTKTEEHTTEQRVVGLTPEQTKTIGLVTSGIEQKAFTNTLKVTGKLEVPPQNKASVTSLYSGVIRSIDVQPGSTVQKGQLVATITNIELSGIQQQYLSVAAQLRLAELEVARQDELVRGNAAPLKNLQKAQSDLSSLRAQQSALSKQLSDLGVAVSTIRNGNISSTIRITAPIGGTISEIHTRIGSNVDANTPMAEIVNNSRLHLDLYVFEKDLGAIRRGQTIHFTLTNRPGVEYDAQIFSIGTAFTDETKSIPVHAEVRGDKTGLIAGMNATAIISLDSKMALTVPGDAIVTNGGNDYIFIRTDKQTAAHSEEGGAGKEQDEKPQTATINFERIQVVRGATELGYTEIKPVSALPGGAQIVTKGAFFLMAKMTNTGEHED